MMSTYVTLLIKEPVVNRSILEMDELYKRLEKQIPALRLQIQQMYVSYDRKYHLHGASVPVVFGMDQDVLGSYTPSGDTDEGEHFYFSLRYVASYEERPITNEDRLDIFRHEYAHYMQYNMQIPKEYTWKSGKHGSAWKYCCSLTGAVPTEFYRAGETLKKHDYDSALKNPWKGTTSQLLDTFHRESADRRRRDSKIIYQTGETVVHPKFGEGVIHRIEQKEGSVILHIQFSDQLRKIDQKWLNRTRYNNRH